MQPTPPVLAAPAPAQRGLLLIILTAILWGTIAVATRAIYGMSDANALSVGFFRLAFAAPVIFLASWWATGRPLVPIASRRDLGLLLLLGLSMALYQVTYFGAIAEMGVIIAALVGLCSAPVMVALLSALLLHERLTPRVLLALVCALAGTALLIGAHPAEALQHTTIAGVLLALGAGLSYSVVTLCSRALAQRYHPLQPISVGFVVGALLLLPVALAMGLVVRYPPAGWLLLLHLGLVPTALGYLLFLSGLRTTTATVASIVTLLEPLTSAVLAWLLFHEQLDAQGLLGAALLLSALLVLYIRRR